MSKIYQDSHRTLQDNFDSRRLADRIEEKLHETELSAGVTAFIQSAPLFFLTTVDQRGYPTCSYKGGAPGFVRVVNPKTLIFPSYNGNGMFLSTGNIMDSEKIGMLFINFEKPSRIRIHGEASINLEDEALKDFPGAELIVRVNVHEVFPNCPRYIHQFEMKSLSTFVPDSEGNAPTPNWKNSDWAKDVLPKPKNIR
jgi:predicted pyridoxine 5'-phosphate oxidase superfamily flavin-nucleotide-binding protein